MSSIEQIIQRQFRVWEENLAVQERRRRQGGAAIIESSDVVIHPVICLSREPGAGAWDVAEGLSKALGCQIFGREVIDHIAADLNTQRQVIEIRGQQVRSEVELLVEGMLRGRHVENREYLLSLCRVIEGSARNGNVVLLGRGANVVLGNRASLRVRLVAPLRDRIALISEKRGLPAPEAEIWIDKMEKGRRAFFQRFFGVDWNDPTLNDLTINSARFTPEQSVNLILAALRERGIDAGGA